VRPSTWESTNTGKNTWEFLWLQVWIFIVSLYTSEMRIKSTWVQLQVSFSTIIAQAYAFTDPVLGSKESNDIFALTQTRIKFLNLLFSFNDVPYIKHLFRQNYIKCHH